jgi:hypothetical protein
MELIFGLISLTKSKRNEINDTFYKILKSETKNKMDRKIRKISLGNNNFQLICGLIPENEVTVTINNGEEATGIYSGFPYFKGRKNDQSVELKKLLTALSSNKSVESWEDLGDFAAVLYNNKNQTLIVCRDAFGTVPLYFEEGDGWIAFSNNLRTLYKIRNRDRKYNIESIGDYLTFSYFLGPRTMFSTISKLPAMHNSKDSK